MHPLTWPDHTIYKNNTLIVGINDINLLNTPNFYLTIFNYIIIIIKMDKMDNIEMYEKRIIEKEFLSRMQNNSFLTKDKNELINKLRNKMWKNTNKYLTYNELEILFNEQYTYNIQQI